MSRIRSIDPCFVFGQDESMRKIMDKIKEYDGAEIFLSKAEIDSTHPCDILLQSTLGAEARLFATREG